MKRTTIVEVISLLFVALFLYTGISKLMEYDVAVEQIALTPLLAPIAKELVIALPIAEIIASIILFIPRTRIYGLWVSLALMISFTGYIIYIISYNAQLPCTCGGLLEQLSWPGHLILNTILIILLVTAILFSGQVVKQNHEKALAMAHN